MEKETKKKWLVSLPYEKDGVIHEFFNLVVGPDSSRVDIITWEKWVELIKKGVLSDDCNPNWGGLQSTPIREDSEGSEAFPTGGVETPEKKVVFTNSIGEEFYNGDEFFCYSKSDGIVVKGTVGAPGCNVVENSKASEGYRSHEVADDKLKFYEWKRSMKAGAMEIRSNLIKEINDLEESLKDKTVVDLEKTFTFIDKEDYRPFKPEEAEEYLGLKVKCVKSYLCWNEGDYHLINVGSIDNLEAMYRRFLTLDGKPVGKLKSKD